MMKKISILLISGLLVSTIACRDEALYPLPYNDRETGAYLRMYSIATNVLDATNFASSGFETEFETVDDANGTRLESIDFYASFRSGNNLTSEVFVKNVPASVFSPVQEPTISTYKRGRIRITHAEMQAALLTALPPSDGPQWPSLALKISYPGAMVSGNQVVLRWVMKLTDGREFTVLNPQGTNPEKANTTANITGGQFYSSPFQYTLTVRTLPANAFLQTYRLEQFAIWSPNHSVDQHRSAFPASLNQVLYPAQDVTLATVPGGLSTQRQLQITNYRGGTLNLLVNFEASDPLPAGTTDPNRNAIFDGLGYSVPNRTVPRGTVWVALQKTGATCSAERGIYLTMPAAGVFGNASTATNQTASNSLPAGLPPMPAGTPQFQIFNRGVYLNDPDGVSAVGSRFYIALDDDADEYGRRQGYCTWTRRVYLRLTKL